MHILSVVRPKVGRTHGARTSIAILFFVFLAACGGGNDDGGAPDAAPASPGSLDSIFSTDGIVTTSIGTDSTSALALGVQTDGKIVVAGNATNDGINFFFALARYNTDGTLDTTFGVGGIVTTAVPGTTSSSAAALGLQTDGKIVVAGTADGNIALARYNSDGTLDSTFDTDGIVTTTTIGTGSSALAVGLQTDGKIVVTGNATIGGVENFVVVRYNTNGSLDTSFDTDGIVTTSIGTSSNAFALALQSDGKIVAAGKSDSGASENVALARYNSGGSLDTSFDFDGIVTTVFAANSVAFALALQSDGKLVVAGNAGGEIVVVRYTSSGALDTTFSSDGVVITPLGIFASASALALQSDGKLVVAGTSDGNFVVARYNSSGTSDTSFGSGGIVTTAIGISASASALALQSDGKIVAAGSSDGSIAVARYNP